MEQVILESISKHVKNKNVTGGSQHEFMKEKYHLANLIAFCDVMTLLVRDVVYLGFTKAFDAVSCNIFVGKNDEVQTR